MLKPFSLFFSLAVLCGALASAQSRTVTITAPNTPANDGKLMYESYCTSCHGVDGRGHGPTASSLKIQPADLTTLSNSNHGVYPAEYVNTILRFGVQTPAHGSKAMPVWGPVLGKIDRSGTPRNQMQALRISNLVHYVQTLQAK